MMTLKDSQLEPKRKWKIGAKVLGERARQANAPASRISKQAARDIARMPYAQSQNNDIAFVNMTILCCAMNCLPYQQRRLRCL